jgi:hypothetical protein
VLEFFYFIFIHFAKIQFSKTNLPPPCTMVVVANRHGPRRFGTVALQPPWPTAVRFSLFSKHHNFFMNSDGDKLYRKFVAFNEIYNFLVQTFSFEVILRLKKLIYCPDLDTEN